MFVNIISNFTNILHNIMSTILIEKQNTKTKLLVKNKELTQHTPFSFLTDYKQTLINNDTVVCLQSNLVLSSRITTKGKIKFCNTDFCSAVQSTSKKIQNEYISSFYHPEMPKVIFEHIKESLEKNNNAIGIIKQIDKNGNTNWLNTYFLSNLSGKLNIACNIKATPSSTKTIERIAKIYNTVFLLENNVSYDIAKKYFEGLLEMEYGNYEGFIISIFE